MRTTTTAILLLLNLVFCGLASSTTINVANKCSYNVAVIYTANINERPEPSVNWGTLSQGQSLSKDGGSNVYFNLKNGDNGKTYAEFSINPSTWVGHDSYDLSIILGYDTPMQIISSNGGGNPICTAPGCADAFHNSTDYSKVHVANTGGTFTVVLCP